ncbi:hypothetical protein [Microbacterium sp. BR1]|uniref:hypothetical protein n=1 Tax=Microbacterium sp. BR1 TaxID=1070896 RepID=UPI000C2CACD3|nr:hypothetical protein [Microbacterium sp. BR1]
MSILAFLAAIIPIGASLYAGASFVIEQTLLARERRMRLALAPRVQELHERARLENRATGSSPDSPEGKRVRAIPHRVRDRILRMHRIPVTHLPYLVDQVDREMSAGVVSTKELVRQWVLLLSAAVGLILLALDSFIAAGSQA